ncbi:hypothetical protein ACFXMT_21165 [Streptomyces mirabilis]
MMPYSDWRKAANWEAVGSAWT